MNLPKPWMLNIKQKIATQVTYTAIRDYLPEDHSDPWSLLHYLKEFYAQSSEPARVLDLGCGEGDSIELFRRLVADPTWYGVDIENSPEVKKRARDNELITSFNGIDLPYATNYFDLIYCHQVLEHVRHPDALVADAFRVLKPNGVFLGAVSYLEPYHSYSIFNFTPYGIVRVFGDAGFALKEIRPGVDAAVLINRQLLNRSKILSPIWKCNFLYGITGVIASIFGLNHRERNFLKVQFSGHMVFIAQRPA